MLRLSFIQICGNNLENNVFLFTFAMKMKNLVLIFALLLTLDCCTTEADRNRMRAGLDALLNPWELVFGLAVYIVYA